MGHVALPMLQQLVKNEMVAGIRVKGEPDEVLGCPTCMQAKFTRYPFSSSEATAKAPLDEVVMDAVAPLKLGAAGAEYFLTIVDVCTCMTWVYVLSKKSDVGETVKTDWLPMVERQQDRLVKAIRTDRGGEFLRKEFSLWLKKNGIRHSLTMPYSPAMNGIAERANRTITETARGLLIEAGLPDYFWLDAVRSACVAKNRALTHVGADKWVPYVEWIGRNPKVDMLRVFGCMCMALVPKHLRHNKLGAKAIWAGLQFMENLMYKDWKVENEAKIGMRFGEVKSSGLEHVELPLEMSSSSTTTRQSSLVNGGDEAKDAEEEEEEVQQSDQEECAFAFFSLVEMLGEPATLKEALESSDAEEWKKAMESELKSIEENGTWELVELSEGRRAITSKWLFKIKSDADGKIERYKSRLMAKGYQQKEKVDYKEFFAPVVKPTTLRTLLAGAAIKGWVVKQMDVTTAFLNGALEEDIFMAQPEGFDDGSGRVLKLKKAFYGLKQGPRQWYLKLRGVLEEIGFTTSTADHSLFMLGEGKKRSFMVVYVDDILIFSPSFDLVKEVMVKLQVKFKCKALGDVSFYLGLHIERDVDKRCMRVHQRKYLEALAANFGQSEGHVATPFPSGFKCVKGPEEESVGEEERRRFHSLVGSLMYAAVNTRPDVAFATVQLARVVQCPNEEQVAVGMRVAKYLDQTPTVGLQYLAAAQRRQKGTDGVEPGRLILTAFSDAAYASEPEDMTSVGGFICCVGGGPTSWESEKQVDQALSSVESEYMALFRAPIVTVTHEELWLHCPPGFTGSFPFGTQWSLRRPVYGLHQAPCEWHVTLRTTLAALCFAPSIADPSLFLRTDATLPLFYIFVYVDDLVFATANSEALAHMKSELQKRQTCTDQAPPSDESVEPSGPYPAFVGCLMCLMTCTRPDLAFSLSLLACYVAPGRHRKTLPGLTTWLCSSRHRGYTFTLGSSSVSWRSTHSSSVLSSSCEAEIYAGAMTALELRWLTYLLTDLGEAPRSPPVLYVDNKAMLTLCQEHRLEHRTKHIALRYFLARELQQCGQLRLAFMASRANTTDVFTKAL
ncbi:unnamed protein product [Closterium sp. NIES-54]